jgi:NodT family efflux transporter outer membrane factor (OMF) lipoprotein
MKPDMPRIASRLLSFVVCCVASGCAVGPDYKRPETPVPQGFKEVGNWKSAEPRDAAERGRWWEIFGDEKLNELESQLEVSNQTLRASEAQYRQAYALVRSARSSYYPTIRAGGSATRSESGTGAANAGSPTLGIPIQHVQNTYSLSADASWELDLWGKLRRQTESARATAEASAADLAGARLSLQAELAADYFSLRIVDETNRLLERTVTSFQEAVRLTTNRYNAGVVSRSDVVQSQAQLKIAQAQLIDLGSDRAQLEHAIAVLLGKAPADFALEPIEKPTTVPDAPQAVPSAVLEQRPDIAGAERRVASANAQIGVARAAFFPDLTLSGTGGYRSSSTANLISLPNRFWSVGPALAQTLFAGGALRAQSARAEAAYDESVANYRQTVLTGFQEVEDNLAALRILNDETQVENEAVDLVRESVLLITNQYKAGTVGFLDVVNLQQSLYTNERTALGLQGRRLAAYINLVKALGGGWSADELKSASR